MQTPDKLLFMDPTAVFTARSAVGGQCHDVNGIDSFQFNEEIDQLMIVPHENASSFTALLELPATQAVELLHLPEPVHSSANVAGVPGDLEPRLHSFGTLTFPSNPLLMESAGRFTVADMEQNGNISPDTTSLPSNSSANLYRVKTEPVETESSQRLVSDPAVEYSQSQSQNYRSAKRKTREKKVKGAAKKCKSSEDAEKLPYVHVRARRGQATDSHSLAERARREKINARMRLLQELVPGCNKIQGTALVLDEIINHVQSLQRHVELLSMRLAAVNPRIDFNLDSILATESGSLVDSNLSGTVMPKAWDDVGGHRQPYHHHHQQPQWPFDAFHQPVWGRDEYPHDFITAENSLSTALHSNQVKMEL